jgi:hypothetical protein
MITFNTEKLRSAPENGFPFKIKRDRGVTLILVKCDGNVSFAVNQREKDLLRAKYEDGDLLMLAWVGEYRTDIFHVTRKDLERDYE